MNRGKTTVKTSWNSVSKVFQILGAFGTFIIVAYMLIMVILFALSVQFTDKPISKQEYGVSMAINATGALVGVLLGAAYTGTRQETTVEDLRSEIKQLRVIVEQQNMTLSGLLTTTQAAINTNRNQERSQISPRKGR